MENRYIFHILHFSFVDEEVICQVWEEESSSTYWYFNLNLHEFDMSLDDERVQRSEGIQNWSCQQIWGRHHGYVCTVCLETEDNTFLVRTLVFEMFPRFSNTLTYLNKQTISWCKDFLWRHVFLNVFLWSWQKDVNIWLRICFVSRNDTSTRNISTWA